LVSVAISVQVPPPLVPDPESPESELELLSVVVDNACEKLVPLQFKNSMLAPVVASSVSN
jgi:hypothetical protein